MYVSLVCTVCQCLSCHLHCCQCVIFVSGVSYVFVTVHVVLLHHCSAQLEARVAQVEERLLEKELLHDQVRQITARLEAKTRTLKPSSLSVAEKVS